MVTVGPKPHQEAALGPGPSLGRVGDGAQQQPAGVELVHPSGPLAGVRRGFSVSRRVASRRPVSTEWSCQTTDYPASKGCPQRRDGRGAKPARPSCPNSLDEHRPHRSHRAAHGRIRRGLAGGHDRLSAYDPCHTPEQVTMPGSAPIVREPATYGLHGRWPGPRRFLGCQSSCSGRCLAGGATRRSSTVEVAASPPTVRLGSEQAFQLHQAPDLGAVGTEVGLNVRGHIANGGQVDTEQLRAPFRRRCDRPAQVQVMPSPHRVSLSNACSRSNRESCLPPPGQPSGHFWATSDRIAADNKGHCRPSICPAHRAGSPTVAGGHEGPSKAPNCKRLERFYAHCKWLLAICWQPASQQGPRKASWLVGVTGIEPVTSAV